MGVVTELYDRLEQYGGFAPLPEVGCFRRNVWTEQEQSWKLKRSNMLLNLLGYHTRVTSVTGREYIVFTFGDWLLQFRAGPYRNHWTEDIELLSSIVATQYPIKGTILLWENEGEISINELPLPEGWESMAATLKAGDWTNEDDHPPRIRKDSQRASGCFYCPVKARCDATDRLFDECGDWADGYEAGPPRG